MRQSRQALRTSVFDDRAHVARRVGDFLRGLYSADWAKSVARDLDVSVHTVRKLDERDSAPSLAQFKRMVKAYGPEAVAALFDDSDAPEWLSDAVRQHRLSVLEAKRAELEARIEDLRRG